LLAHKKKKQKERATRCPGPSGFLVLLAVDGTLKTHPPPAGSDKSSVLSVNICDAQQDKMGPQKQNDNKFTTISDNKE